MGGGFGGSQEHRYQLHVGKTGQGPEVHGVDRRGATKKSCLECPMKEGFMEAMTNSGKDYIPFQQPLCPHQCAAPHVNGMRCGTDLLRSGIPASSDFPAIDQASVDLVYALPEKNKKTLWNSLNPAGASVLSRPWRGLGWGNARTGFLNCRSGVSLCTTKRADPQWTVYFFWGGGKAYISEEETDHTSSPLQSCWKRLIFVGPEGLQAVLSGIPYGSAGDLRIHCHFCPNQGYTP